jgi:hypothetical protein
MGSGPQGRIDTEHIMAFRKDLSTYREALNTEHYALIEDALSNEFVSHLISYRDRIASGRLKDIPEWHIDGKKRQYLFDFPSAQMLDAFLKGMGAVIGAAADTLTIGERHIKCYLDEAKALPAPHLDRHASQFTVGFPIHIPEKSQVCFFPHLGTEENTDERARFLDIGDNVDMEAFYDDPHIVKFRGKVGDMVIFHGSRVWHERIHPASAVILYTKINAMGEDPLGENRSLREKLLEPA